MVGGNGLPKYHLVIMNSWLHGSKQHQDSFSGLAKFCISICFLLERNMMCRLIYLGRSNCHVHVAVCRYMNYCWDFGVSRYLRSIDGVLCTRYLPGQVVRVLLRGGPGCYLPFYV